MLLSTGTTVGLSIGIPVGVILILFLAIWMRNHKRLKNEDKETELDVELRDDQVFNRFQEELHRPYNNAQDVVAAKSQPYEFVEKPSMTSTDSTSSTKVVERLQKRTASSYDFYDSFIPVLPEGAEHSSTVESEVGPPQIPQSNQDSSASLSPSINDKSLEHLAKKLNGPAFFEKLPSRNTSLGLKQKSFSLSTTSSTDVIDNLVQQNGMNEHYTFSKKEYKHPYSQYAVSSTHDDSNVEATSLNEFTEPRRSVDLHKVETSSLESPFEDDS